MSKPQTAMDTLSPLRRHSRFHGQTEVRDSSEVDFVCGLFDKYEARGLLERSLQGVPFGNEDYELLRTLSLPLLGKLVEMKLSRATDIPSPYIRPILLMPLGNLLHTKGVTRAVDECFSLLRGLDSKCRVEEPIRLILDRWTSKIPLARLLEELGDAISRLDTKNGFVLLGPDSSSLRKLLRYSKAPSPVESISLLLRELFSNGINEITLRDDATALRLAVEAGFSVSAGQEIYSSDFEEGQKDANCPSSLYPPTHATGASPLSFFEGLKLNGDTLSSGTTRQTWFPNTCRPPDTNTSDERAPSGIELLRAVAIARLLLQERIAIGAPISIFGPKLALAAISFGASDLGCAALNSQTASFLGLSTFSELDAFFEAYPALDKCRPRWFQT